MLWTRPKQSISPRLTLVCLYHACAVNSARDIYSSHMMMPQNKRMELTLSPKFYEQTLWNNHSHLVQQLHKKSTYGLKLYKPAQSSHTCSNGSTRLNPLSLPYTFHITAQASHSNQNKTISDHDFIHIIRNIIEEPEEQTCKSPPHFRFEMTSEAAKHNTRTLESFQFDLEAAIAAQQDSPVSFGSEFRHWSKLEPLLKRHPLWTQIKEILSNGATFPLQPITNEERATDKNYMLQ